MNLVTVIEPCYKVRFFTLLGVGDCNSGFGSHGFAD